MWCLNRDCCDISSTYHRLRRPVCTPTYARSAYPASLAWVHCVLLVRSSLPWLFSQVDVVASLGHIPRVLLNNRNDKEKARKGEFATLDASRWLERISVVFRFRKPFFAPSLTLKFLCAGYLNRGFRKISRNSRFWFGGFNYPVHN